MEAAQKTPSKAAVLRAQLEGAPPPPAEAPAVDRPAQAGPKMGEEAYRVVYADREVTVPGLRPWDFVRAERYLEEADHRVAEIEQLLYQFWLALKRHRTVEERPGEFECWAESVVDFYDFREPAPGADDRPLA